MIKALLLGGTLGMVRPGEVVHRSTLVSERVNE